VRNTDADWVKWAEQEPYFAVLSSPTFYTANLNEASLESFFQSGVLDIEYLMHTIRTRVFPGFAPRSALDFGSGVGRLVLAMAAHVERVVGVDIAPPMIAEAKRNCAARAPGHDISFYNEIPEGEFDWISSVLVIQHIPPAIGLGILQTLLSRLAVGGVISLQFTAYRTPAHLQGAFDEARYVRFDGARLDVLDDQEGPELRMAMFDYDMTAVLSKYADAGVNDMWLRHVDHGGHHAFWVIGRKE
jgi:SAM-dependent methyltransferase